MADAFSEAPKKRVVGTPIKPGQVLNPNGRPKGSRNKLGEMFIEALYESFKEKGVDAIDRVRVEQPAQYLKVIASLMPKEFHVKDPVFDAMNDEQLADLIGEVRAARAAAAARAKAASGTQLTDRVH